MKSGRGRYTHLLFLSNISGDYLPLQLHICLRPVNSNVTVLINIATELPYFAGVGNA